MVYVRTMSPGESMRLSALMLTLVFSAFIASWCFASPSLAAPAAKQDLTSLVTEMEQVVFGATRKNAPLATRIKNLEIQAMCQAQTGTLKARVDKLISVVGLNHSDYLPPVAPTMDSDQKKPGVALDRLTHQRAPHQEDSLGQNPRDTHAQQAHRSAGQARRQSTHPVAHTVQRATLRQEADMVRQNLVSGIKLHREGRLAEAEDRFKEVLKLEPYNGDACFSLGSLAEERGDLAGALGYYSAASVANPNDREAKDAVLQVQERISARQGPFVNPLVSSRDGQAPLLQARAAEFTDADLPEAGVLYTQNPIPAAPVIPAGYPSPAIHQPPVPTVNIGQNPPPQRRSSGTGKAVARGLARMAVGAALNYSGLHCPLCNILRGF